MFVDVTGPRGRGFLGIEVKYHENMRSAPATDKGYTEMARQTGVFAEAALETLGRPPLQQLWLDHLLALRLRAAAAARWDWGVFVLLYPSRNTRCDDAAVRYRGCLTDGSTFRTLTLEDYLDALVNPAGPGWAQELRGRYLGHPTSGK